MKPTKLLFILLIALLPIIGYTIKPQGSTIYNPTPMDVIYPIQDDSAPALMALAAIHTPMETLEGWSKMVCTGMTEGGCHYFKTYQATDTWETHASNIGSSSGYIETVKTIDEQTELWKASVTIFAPEDEATSDVFALVRRGEDGKWRLDRIISGPGVPLP